MSGSGVKKVAEVAAKATQSIDWDGMAKLLVSDEARKEFSNLRRAFDEVNQQLKTKFSMESEVPSGLESIDDLTFQHSNQTNGPLSSSNATSSDWNGELQMDPGTMKCENSEEHGLPKVLEDVDTEPQYQDVLELEQQILEDRTTSENSGDAGANMSPMTLRKSRIAKNKTNKFEDRSNDECGTDNYLPEMNDNQSDHRHGEEDMPKPKRAKRKSNKQTTEIKKPARRSKKAPEKCNSSIENSPKKKFPHTTRRKRRQANKVLLQTPEDEIDPRQISIKDLIMLAEAKERISNKEAAAMGKLFSNQRYEHH
ncbi:hypothetical protein Cni_G06431 [Canna indica]|uniref:ATP synthase subunit d, mitochondrial n=1 Tax=Canna indica TaxID=4628 RepID=A0AAQ3JYI0_9LILI|nr:hypothetical protein Cni_G06431 [Canna indica]